MGATIGFPTRRTRNLVGSYAGNGIDNRNLDIGINLAAKNNVYIIIKSTGAMDACHRAEMGQGDLTQGYGAGAEIANAIQALTNTGFQLGDGGLVNQAAANYRYEVFWEEP